MMEIVLTAERREEWLLELCVRNGLSSKIGPRASRDPYGSAYVALGFGGVKPEGFPSPVSLHLHNSAGVGWMLRAAEQDLLNFLGGRKHIIWRERPEFTADANVWRFYCRLTAYPSTDIPFPKLETV